VPGGAWGLVGYEVVDSLVSAPASLAINRAKARDDDADGYFGCPARAASARRAASGTGLTRPRHHAHDFGVAHLEVARTIGSGLGADLGVDAPQLVPSAPINAEQCEAVG